MRPRPAPRLLAGALALVAGCPARPGDGQFVCANDGVNPCPEGLACLPHGAEHRCYREDRHVCGNGVVEPGEQCDGETVDPGICTALGHPAAVPYCLTECLVHCAFCGNGFQDVGEACDDGEANSDGAPDACRTDCQAAGCGDGVVDSGEVCDDGNREDGDGCSADCRSLELCGDGVRSPELGEGCDGDDLGSLACASLDASAIGGQLVCTPDCTIDARGCVTVLLDGLDGTYGLAVDETHLYFTEPGGGRVRRVPRAGGAPEVLAEGLVQPMHLVVDATAVYFTLGQGAAVGRVDRAGGAPVEWLATGLGAPHRIVQVGDALVFTDPELGAVLTLPKAGGVPTPLASVPAGPLQLAVDATHAYFTTRDDEALRRVPLAGGATTLVAQAGAQVLLGALAVDEASVYVASQGGGVVWRVAKTGGPLEELAVTGGLTSDLLVDGARLWWTDLDGQVWRLDLTGGDPVAWVSGQGTPQCLLRDDLRVYCSDLTGRILRTGR